MKDKLQAWPKSVVLAILPLLMVLSGLAWYLAEFTSWRSELLGPAGENPPVLTKLDLWLAEPEGKNRIKPEVVILSSSLLMTAALFADHRLYGKAVLPDHESLEQAYPTYDKFLCLQNALQKSRPFCRIINLAGPGAMISEQLLLLKTILKNGMKPYLLILAVAPRDFIDRTEPGFHQSALAQRLLERLMPQAWDFESSTADNLERYAGKYWYYFCHRAAFKKFLSRPLEKDNNPSGPLSGTRLEDRASDPERLQADLQYYKKRYLPIDYRRWQQESTSLRQIAAICRQEKLPLLLVSMPLSKANLALLPPAFRADYKRELELLSKKPVVLLDISEDADFQSDDFCDSVHLNSKGGEKLSTLLQEAIEREN